MEAENPARSQPEDCDSNRPVQRDEAGELGNQPVGVQAGARLFAKMGRVDARRLRRRMVLYCQPRLLRYTGAQASTRRTHRQLRRPLESRSGETTVLGISRRKLLVRRYDHLKRDSETRYPPDRLPSRGHILSPSYQAPVFQDRLQQGNLYSLWW